MLKSGLIVWLLAGLLDSRRPSSAPVTPPPQPAQRFTVRTDSVPSASISGVILPAEGKAKGTLILCHGWGRRKEDLYGWDWVRRELGWNLILFDLREHGQSTRSARLCTLGYHEIWDVKAVVDHAQKQGLRPPYAIYGHSLGASVGLRWAGQDGRVRGVLAVSPFRNALSATQIFTQASFNGFDPSRLHRGFRRMLAEVDLPRAVSQRPDLHIWIMCGQRDIFPASDQRAMLDASPAPAGIKRLYVVPGGWHHNLWQWQGDAKTPSHDQIMREFLRSVRADE